MIATEAPNSTLSIVATRIRKPSTAAVSTVSTHALHI
jgi:hypothetical protein